MTTTMISSFNSKALNCVLWNMPKFSSPPPNLFSSTKRRRLQQIRKKKAHDQATVSSLISSTAVYQTTTLPVELTALVTVRKSLKLSIQDMMLHWFGNHDHFSHHKEKEKCLVLQLVSTETEAESTKPKLSNEAILDWSKDLNLNLILGAGKTSYEVQFEVDPKFGMPGAITVRDGSRNFPCRGQRLKGLTCEVSEASSRMDDDAGGTSSEENRGSSGVCEEHSVLCK